MIFKVQLVGLPNSVKSCTNKGDKMSTLNNNEKPTFGANTTTTTPNTELADKRKQRPEVGQIWNKQSKTNNLNYMTIRLKVTKEKLKEMLNQEPNAFGEVSLNLVAFPNKNQEGLDKRPSFRIYEEIVNPNR